MIPQTRPARAEDGPVCIPLIAEAGGELLAWAMGGSEARGLALIERCWATRNHPLGPMNTTVVELDGVVVGAVVGAAVKRWVRAERRTPIRMTGLGTRRELRALSERLNEQRRSRPELDPSTWYLSSLGILPAYRRRGLGRMLLATCRQHSRAHQLRGISVEVVAANLAAHSLYLGEGFQEVRRWTPKDGPEVVRLVRTED